MRAPTAALHSEWLRLKLHALCTEYRGGEPNAHERAVHPAKFCSSTRIFLVYVATPMHRLRSSAMYRAGQR